MVICNNQHCNFKWCLQSRAVMNHYHKCVDRICAVCAPLRRGTNAGQRHAQKDREELSSDKMRTPAKKQRLDRGSPRGLNDLSHERRAGGKWKSQVQNMHIRGAPTYPANIISEQNAFVIDVLGDEQPHARSLEYCSALETFDQRQLHDHLNSLKQESNLTDEQIYMRSFESPKEFCSLCGLDRLLFEPPLVYCRICGTKIKRNALYYTSTLNKSESGDNRIFYCSTCHGNPETIPEAFHIDGVLVLKKELDELRNNDSQEEMWVKCEECSKWCHHVCALYNSKSCKTAAIKNYVCPHCFLRRMNAVDSGVNQKGSCKGQPFNFDAHYLDSNAPIPASRVLPSLAGAQTLAQTDLSAFIERRLSRSLLMERELRAKQMDLPVIEVPTAEGLTLRVVSCTDKLCKILPNFAEYIKSSAKASKRSHTYRTKLKRKSPTYRTTTKQERISEVFDGSLPQSFGRNYMATEFQYRSKAVLLFQRIDHVDVCLFAIYVQEYGSDAPFPNRRKVYLSYVDSVKYFRPTGVKAANGDYLRSFVYHQILIGYLAYVRKRGFVDVHIWACPPTKGDDYIFYCHPDDQKPTRADRLRAWYRNMLLAAMADGIVHSVTNLYDGRTLMYESVIERDQAFAQNVDQLLRKVRTKDLSDVASAANAAIQTGPNVVRPITETGHVCRWHAPFFRAANSRVLPPSPAHLPYFDGDFWPPLIEDFVNEYRSVEDSASATKLRKTGSYKRNGRQVTKAGGQGTEGTTMSAFILRRVREVLAPMKDNFIVVHLRPTCSVCNDTVYFPDRTGNCADNCSSGDTAEEFYGCEVCGEVIFCKACIALCCNVQWDDWALQQCIGLRREKAPPDWAQRCDIIASENSGFETVGPSCNVTLTRNQTGKACNLESQARASSSEAEEMPSMVDEGTFETQGNCCEPIFRKIVHTPLRSSDPGRARDLMPSGDAHASEEKVRVCEGEIKGVSVGASALVKTCQNLTIPAPMAAGDNTFLNTNLTYDDIVLKVKENHMWPMVKVQTPECVASTVDADPTLECEIFDTRQAFLSLCQGNHYQFDSLRRAKHSSMMVLYHLHNPDAPAFVYSCDECQCEISEGTGWHCVECKDYDLCDSCKGRVTHSHPLVPLYRNHAIDAATTRVTPSDEVPDQLKS